MSFLNSLPLWGGLAALGVALPILIHLWSRRQKIEIHWAAMELLKKAMVKRSQQIRMEDRLLLLLRCLALLLIALALLRPLFNAGSDAGGSSDVGVVIGIDASYSMGHGQPARFEQAVARARDVLSTLSEGSPVSIVLMSSHPQILFRGVGYDAGACNKALDDVAKVSAYPLNLERNLEQLQELVGELKTAVRECHIITDAQESDWQALSDQARNTLQELGEKAHVLLSPVASVGADNLSDRMKQQAQSVGANAVAVACPLCHANLDMRQSEIEEKFTVSYGLPTFYFTQLMGLALGIPAEELGFAGHMIDPRPLLREKELMT